MEHVNGDKISMTTTMSSTQPRRLVLGIDTHQRTHHAALLDLDGTPVADAEFPANEPGYTALIDWAGSHGEITVAGVESTGSYGAGVTRRLLVEGWDLREVNRPDIRTRAAVGKSDPIDAASAARAALSGAATARPKVTTGVVESVRVLLVTRDSAVRHRTAAGLQLRDLITTAPAELHDKLIGMTTRQRVVACVKLRPDLTRLADPAQAVKVALRALAHRIQELDAEIKDADRILDTLVADTVPTLITHRQIGTITAAQLLVTAGQNLDRMRSEASFAKLTGTAPIPASSGKTRRFRLNRGGDRQANKALHIIAVGRLRSDPVTRDYAARRLTEGLGKLDILRCLKRAIAREVFGALRTDLLKA